MTDHHQPGWDERDLGSVEVLLRTMTDEDLESLDPPDGLWSRIEAGLNLADN